MEWVYGVIKALESDPKLRLCLKVRFNDSVVEQGNRLENFNNTFLQNSENKEKGITSIRFTEPVKLIQEACSSFKKYGQLIDEISKCYENVAPVKIEILVKQLLDNEYLLSELRPPLCNTDPLEYLISVLVSYDTDAASFYLEKLKEIQNMIRQYNQANLGNGISLYNEIIQKMQELYHCKNYIQVDLRISETGNTLSYKKKKELEEFISVMNRLDIEHKQCDEMSDYINEFLEKYGFYSEVCVTNLLSQDKGLGVPKHYLTNSPSYSKSLKERRLETLLDSKILECIQENRKCVNLEELDITSHNDDSMLKKYHSPVDSLSSFELYLLVHNDCDEKYSFTVAPAIGSNGVGKSFGRFADMLTDSECTLLKDASEKEKELLSGYLFAEIMEIPARGRTNNITLNNSNHDYQVVLNSNYCVGKTTIPINDLYIGVDRYSRRFYIKSKKYNKRVIVSMTSMLNPMLGSVVLRFLRDISSTPKFDIVKTIRNIAWSQRNYTPRIAYKSIIIKPETWILSAFEFANKLDSDFENAMLEHRKKWRIPRYVYLTVNDNRLLLDLDCKLHIKEIANELKSRGSAKLVENTIDIDNNFTRDNDGNSYVSEIVVPFLRNEMDNEEPQFDIRDTVLHTHSNVEFNKLCVRPHDQILLPGVENWLYFKLYGNSTRQNELLTLLFDELEKMKIGNILNKYFFIRYSDPKPHIRLRIEANNYCLAELFENSNKLFVKFREWGLISSVVVDSYQRETERYGGPQLIREAEEYFYQESRFMLKLLQAKRLLLVNIDEDLLVMSFLSGALDIFGLSLAEKVQFMDIYRVDTEYRKNFQKNRNRLMNIVDTSNNWENAKKNTEYAEVFDWINELFVCLNRFATKISEIDMDDELTNTRSEILASIIHMFCNRLFANTSRERKIYILSRHSLYALSQQHKHYRK